MKDRWTIVIPALALSALLVSGCAPAQAAGPATPTQAAAPAPATALPTQAPTAVPTQAAQPAEEGEVVDGWIGTIVKLPPGNQFGSYFQRQDGERYDIGSADPDLREKLSELRGSGAKIKVWGRLFRGAPADLARHIEVERLQVVQ